MDYSTKQVVITGANRGIGLALVKQYVSRGASVIALCREASAELEATGARIEQGVDLTSDDLSQQLSERLAGSTIDILVNNAGMLASESLGSIDYDNVRAQLEINALGPLRVTEALLPLMATNSRIGLVTSRMGSIADNGSGGYYGYRMSKAALNAAGMSLARDLKPRGIAVAILHPGFVQTRMVNFAGDVSADDAAAGLVARLAALTLSATGTFWHANGDELPW
ncbi:SDR family oxidoreductase [Teredinibacter turnerae]|uniref:SDR family oxidoreductase n=1 Tax=Teredinibacter turnerae TaxID=2426 RepID=UPI0030D0D2D1